MTDIFDRASDREEAQREAAIAEARYRGGLEGKTVKDSARYCRVCKDHIPLARRHALPGVQLCVECQTDLERATRP